MVTKLFSVLEKDESSLSIEQMYSNERQLCLNVHVKENINVYAKHMFYDSLFNSSCYLSSNNNLNKLYFCLDWNYLSDSNWDVDKLFDVIIQKQILNANVEIYNNTLLLISDLYDLIKLMNFIESIDVGHNFIYEVEKIKVNPLINRVKNYNLNKEYFKIIISNND